MFRVEACLPDIVYSRHVQRFASPSVPLLEITLDEFHGFQTRPSPTWTGLRDWQRTAGFIMTGKGKRSPSQLPRLPTQAAGAVHKYKNVDADVKNVVSGTSVPAKPGHVRTHAAGPMRYAVSAMSLVIHSLASGVLCNAASQAGWLVCRRSRFQGFGHRGTGTRGDPAGSSALQQTTYMVVILDNTGSWKHVSGAGVSRRRCVRSTSTWGDQISTSVFCS